MAKRIKTPPAQQGGRIKSAATSSDTSTEQQPPNFSLRYLNGRYCLSECAADERAAFASKLLQLSKLTWSQIRNAPRHGVGSEKIAQAAINAAIPRHVTPDVTLLAIRFDGLKAMVGYRVAATYYILWVDRDFSLYDHGA
ncbi:MAG: hypothetical protein P8173_17515 [Gammaproteobacteria bacterium]